jgi:predicted glutamine amidotransferase
MCRMLAAVGSFDAASLVEGWLAMSQDRNEKHENNSDEMFLHCDGWGAAWLKNGQWEILKSIKPCYEDVEVKNLYTVKSPVLILHARKKTCGKTTMVTTQPFMASKYIFCHNGIIHDFVDS